MKGAPFSPTAEQRQRQGPAAVDSSREGPDTWVMTYMDLITLLLTLFILLLSYSGKGNGEYEEVTKAMAEATDGVLKGSQAPAIVEPEPRSPLDTLGESLQRQFTEAGLGAGVDVTFTEGTLDIQLSEKVLFPSGEARFNRRAAAALQPVLAVLEGTDYAISVEGHTDNIPIYTERFPSNWELSVARATSVVRYLIGQGIERQRLKAIGYADTQPIADNASEAGRAKNRRVTLVISPPASATVTKEISRE
jgi:chemotaxis protein MotB